MKILDHLCLCGKLIKLFILGCFISLCIIQVSAADIDKVDTVRPFETDFDRPRLYITKKKITDLKIKIHTKPYNKYWKYIKNISNRTLDTKYFNKINYQGESNIRVIGDRLPYLALSYLLTNDKIYYNGIIDISKYLLELDHWGSDRDLGSAHIIFGLSIIYDWLYDELPKELAAHIKNSLMQHTRILNSELVSKKIWWAQEHSLLQNHNYIISMAIAIAGRSLYGDEPEAEKWLENAKINFDKVLKLLSPDGASHEGVAYWSYGMDALLKYYQGVPIYMNDMGINEVGYFRNAITYRLQMSLPGFSKTANYSDSPEYDYKGPGYMLRLLASKFGDGRGMWLANKIESSRKNNSYSWLDLLWYDENIKATPPKNSETNHLFTNLGILISRSSWDDNASWLLYKAGSSQGEHALKRGVYAGSHIHPDAGHFSLWNNGGWVFNDEGYSLMKKSENHNVILVDGKGQSGEGKRWFDRKKTEHNKSSSKIIKSNISVDQVVVSAQFSRMYSLESNLKSWNRSMHVLNKDSYVIHDTISVKKYTKINSLIHSQKPIISLSDNLFCVGGYYLKVISQFPSKYKNGVYMIPSNDRKNNKGIYSGWLLNYELDLTDKAELFYVITPVSGACEAENYKLDLNNKILSYEIGGDQWHLDMTDDANPDVN